MGDNFDTIPFAMEAEGNAPTKLQEDSHLFPNANNSWRRPPEAVSPIVVSDLGFPSASEILSSSAKSREKDLTTAKESGDSPRNAERDDNGKLTRYSIGPDSSSSQVKVEYGDSSSSESAVQRVEITRQDKERIVYDRERSDPNDLNSPYAYSETRNGIKGDIRFGSFNVERDGRLNLYFDFTQKRLALSFNPQSGAEEYP